MLVSICFFCMVGETKSKVQQPKLASWFARIWTRFIFDLHSPIYSLLISAAPWQCLSSFALHGLVREIYTRFSLLSFSLLAGRFDLARFHADPFMLMAREVGIPSVGPDKAWVVFPLYRVGSRGLGRPHGPASVTRLFIMTSSTWRFQTGGMLQS